MSVETEKGKFNINQVIAKKNANVNIESDCIVPDVKPDIIEIAGTSGIVNIYKKEVSEGRIRIDGCVITYIMYTANENGKNTVRSINHTIDFSQIIAIENATSEMIENTKVLLQSIKCQIINERKINIKVNMNFDVKLFTSSNIEYVNNVKLDDIQKLEKKFTINNVLGMASTKASVSEKVAIDNTNNLAEILKTNVNIMNVETKISVNKILIKADINFKMLYSNEEGKVFQVKRVFPVMGFVDMQDIKEDAICDPNIEIRNMLIKPNGSEDKTVSVDMEIGMQVIAYSSKEINVIRDLYSPSKNLKFNQKNVNLIQNKSVYVGTYSINQREKLDIGSEKVYDTDVIVNIQDKKAVNGAANLTGNIEFTFTHSTAEFTGVSNQTISIPFNCNVNGKNINESSSLSVSYSITNENYNIMPGGEIDLKLDIVFTVSSSNISNVSLIENVEENQNETNQNFNMIIYYTKQNDTLWAIAKRFRSTKDNICKINNLENEKIKPGMQLFIIR